MVCRRNAAEIRLQDEIGADDHANPHEYALSGIRERDSLHSAHPYEHDHNGEKDNRADLILQPSAAYGLEDIAGADGLHGHIGNCEYHGDYGDYKADCPVFIHVADILGHGHVPSRLSEIPEPPANDPEQYGEYSPDSVDPPADSVVVDKSSRAQESV